jgi:hypothetical protein
LSRLFDPELTFGSTRNTPVSLDNTVARGRLLLGVVSMATKLLEVGEHEERLSAIEAALGPRLIKRGSRR